MESDEEDFVFYGKPIDREEDIGSRKKKAVAEASGQLRSLPVWKQEVTDEEGRRRFHGAFTGGFSAGYYNTAGSKEGWAPQAFTSSRKNRAEVKQQSILNFLDEDEKTELEDRSLSTSSQFDTFGFTTAEIARKQAEKEQQHRPSAIPGPAPDEIVLPAAESIGVKLLQKMGWRQGRSIKDSHANALYDARREARKAFLSLSSADAKVQFTDSDPVKGDIENVAEQPEDGNVHSSKGTPIFVLNLKQDVHGLGFDPYKNAPEFREKKRSRASHERGPVHRKGFSIKDGLFGFKSGKVAPGFGIGALEELDAEDEDVYGSGYEFEETYVEEVEEPSRLSLENKKEPVAKERGSLPGFRVASNSDYQMERFEPPVIPKDFVPHHTFSGPLQTGYKNVDVLPPEVPPPEDNNLKLLIEGVATLVARCGKLFEDLSREKNHSNPLFNFLSGGIGHDYYTRKLWEAYPKCNDQTKQHLDEKVPPGVQRMTAESRGKILGERPLDRSSRDSSSSVHSDDVVHLQFNLSDTFTEPASFNELSQVEKPFKDDPAKQERFEQYLKEKYEGGLRSTNSGGAGYMSEAARARERLDFEAAAEAIKKVKYSRESKVSTLNFMEFSKAGGLQFTSGGLEQTKDPQAEDLIVKNMYPKREEFQWRPSPLLCKRFDLIDPFMGKPPPAPRMRGKLDSLLFTSDSVKAAKMEEPATSKKDLLPVLQSDAQDISKNVAEIETEVEVEVGNVERPVDLYKAIFSDDSDEEPKDSNLNRAEDQEKKTEAANTALNRLIAGDFLETLGKELGLEVPPDLPFPLQKTRNLAPQKENVEGRNDNSSPHAFGETIGHGLSILQEDDSHKGQSIHGNALESGARKSLGTSLSEDKFIKLNKGRTEDDSKVRTPLTRQNYSSNSSSEDERSRKRSRRHRHRSSDTESDSSSDHRDRYSSRSRGRKKGSHREKSSGSRKHSKHHKHRRRESPHRSSHHSTEKREKMKWKE
ncbi:G patch domain-containing protein TGH [Quillaja saponaria]|uniref:G patch domain-containing protein TGH n=1 Tax=Quillaja saponaria TaxID=32244 RepID=A0AAD7LEL8_QUISA|nr:G patch domain-containing protein TGH [Quillaja saponaria]